MNSDLDLQYERLLGEGSYGKVFLVKREDGQKFAVKEIELDKCDETGRAQAHGEANLLSRVKHENILRYVESVICDDCLYIVTEFCEGGDLEDYLQLLHKQSMSVPESLISQWILQLGEALKYLHDQKILHRDMKSKNIFLKEDLDVKLGDLGIAKVLDLNQSKANTFIGTPSYMSPELFTGKSYNHKTDIWGLGCCVYEMMTLKRAFQGRALWALIREIKNGGNLKMPDTYSLEIRTLVQDMMAQKPEDRPSANDIVQNELLLYHKSCGKEGHDTLPKPGQTDSKKKSKNGTGSGSWRQLLQQRNQSEEAKYRQTIQSVCEKMTTLKTGTMEEFDTFVYKGGGNGDELEDEGTVLDNSLLKQYTEQLETFVFRGFDDEDSDYFTGGSIGNKGSKDKGPDDKGSDKKGSEGTDNKGSKDEVDDSEDDGEDVTETLIRQYSETLAFNDDDDDDGTVPASHVHDSGAVSSDDVDSTIKKGNVPFVGKRLGELESDEDDDDFDATVNLRAVSKYQYKGLKDTLALRPDKRWKRPHSDPSEWFSPVKEGELTPSKISDENRYHVPRSSPTKSSKSVSILSSTGTINGTRDKVEDSRLLNTLEGHSLKKMRAPKIPISDRIEQSVTTKEESSKLKSPKKAIAKVESPVEEEVNVKGVMSHLKDNITPFMSVDSQTETTQSRIPDVAKSQDPSVLRGKKKESYVKKQSEAKKKQSNADQNGAANDVQLFTRAQAAKFSNDNDKLTIQEVWNQVQKPNSPISKDDQILFVQHGLAAGVGYDNLQQILGVVAMVENEKDMQVHFEAILGYKLYQEFQLHLKAIVQLEKSYHPSASL